MKTLFLLSASVLLSGCNISGGMGSINWSSPGQPDEYTCESAGDNARAYYDTGEHPNLADCP